MKANPLVLPASCSLGAASCVLLFFLGSAPDGLAAPPAAPRPQPAQTELHKLPAEEVIKQAQTIYSQASGAYLAEVRGLVTAQRQFDQAREAAVKHVVPEKRSVSDKLPPLEQAKLQLEETKLRLDALKRRVELLQAEKTSGDRYAAQINLARSAATAFTEALRQLEAYTFELN